MELTYHFRKLVRAQVLLGIVAFCIAEQNPMMLVAAGSLALLSWYIVEGPTGKPLPRWAINIGAVAAVAWLLMDIFSLHQGQIIIAMGHFTIWLQILELYANKTNRDYGLILVLSLTQMVGASILSVSIIYGVLLVAYCVLALFTVLIFHFKSINDFVNEANRSASAESDAVPRPKPVVGRGYRWQFRLTAGAVGGMCAVIAVIVFLLLPRRAPVGSTSGLHGPQGPPTVGFSSQVRLGGPAPRVGSREPIMHVAIDRDGENAGSNDTTFHIRGIALDRYDPYRHTWERSSPATLRDAQLRFDDDGFIGFAELREDVSTYHAQFTLRAASGGVLFTLHPVAELRSVALDAVQFNPTDQKLAAHGAIPGALVYHTTSPVRPPDGLFEHYKQHQTIRAAEQPDIDPDIRVLPERDTVNYARYWPVDTVNLRQYTQDLLRRIDPQLQRDPEAVTTSIDRRIATLLAGHLSRRFTYDLTNPPIEKGKDPILAFLYNQKQGHCELFAAGMAAMCRSIGIPARVVNGFMAAEYNAIGDYYVIRQNNAHAWCEVYCGDDGWVAFDPTPSSEAAAEHRASRDWTTGARELYEHLQYLWLRSVVTYDRDTRDDVINNINRSISQAAHDDATWFGRTYISIKRFLYNWRFDRFSYTLMAVIVVFIIIGIASIVRTLMLRRKRLVALQLTRLPRRDRRRLSRQLRFYLNMLEMLDRHGYIRPEWQTPKSFAEQLVSAAPRRFDPVVRLTDHFYEVRFGHRDLDDTRQQSIRAELKALESNLAGATDS